MTQKKVSKTPILLYFVMSVIGSIIVKERLANSLIQGIVALFLVGAVLFAVYAFAMMVVLQTTYGQVQDDDKRWKTCIKNGGLAFLAYAIAWPVVLSRLPSNASLLFGIVGSPLLAGGVLVYGASFGKPQKASPSQTKPLETFSKYQDKRRQLQEPIAKRRSEQSAEIHAQSVQEMEQKLLAQQSGSREKIKSYVQQFYFAHPNISFVDALLEITKLKLPATVPEETLFLRRGEMLEFDREPTKKIRLRNDEREEWIGKILNASGLPMEKCLQLEQRNYIQQIFPMKISGIFSGDPAILPDGSPVPPIYFDPIVQELKQMQPVIAGYINTRIEYYRREHFIAKAGQDGERAVQQVLDMHKDAFYVIPNLRLEFDEAGSKTSVETDFVVISPFGVAALEVKNYGSTGTSDIHIEADGSWYYENTHTGKRTPIPNPFAQNDRHIAYLEREVNALLHRDMESRIFLDNIIVIANDTVQISATLPSHQVITRTGTLYGHLTASSTQVMTKDEAKMIYENLAARSLKGLFYPIYDYSSELAAMVNLWRQMANTAATYQFAMVKFLETHPEFC